jgi:hypothetical protein
LYVIHNYFFSPFFWFLVFGFFPLSDKVENNQAFFYRLAARLAKLRRFYVWLAVNRLFAAVCGRYKNYYLRFFITAAKIRIVSDYLVLQFPQSVYYAHSFSSKLCAASKDLHQLTVSCI